METVFKALADSTRLRIPGLLVTGEVCVCHMCCGEQHQPEASTAVTGEA
jgi:DNA-binding transcriptional ArsR family regulator